MTLPHNQAFPIAWNQDTDLTADGLTKREYFAAMALQGLLATVDDNLDYQAQQAVKAADALIAALNNKNLHVKRQ